MRREWLFAHIIVEREHRINVSRHLRFDRWRQAPARREVMHQRHLIAPLRVGPLNGCDGRDDGAEERREEDGADHHDGSRVELLELGVRRDPRHFDERGE